MSLIALTINIGEQKRCMFKMVVYTVDQTKTCHSYTDDNNDSALHIFAVSMNTNDTFSLKTWT